MPAETSRPPAALPTSFLAALGLAGAFLAFLVFDQSYWWRMRPEYFYGWLAPVFVLFVVNERWSQLRRLLAPSAPSPLGPGARRALGLLAGGILAAGCLVFFLGAMYRAGSGASQPASLAMALGFVGVSLGLLYFNTPGGAVAPEPGRSAPAGGWRALTCDARLRVAALFAFPAMVWVLSAPLVSAVENTLSLFLLQKIVRVVSFVFEMLGYPLVREGNVLLLPRGQVGVADACSGIRSLTACLFTGTFLAAVFLDRVWKKLALIAAALALAIFTNLLRSLFLTAWAYAYGSDAIGGTFHDATGFAVLGLTFVGLLLLLPLFNGANWLRWLGGAPDPAAVPSAANSAAPAKTDAPS